MLILIAYAIGVALGFYLEDKKYDRDLFAMRQRIATRQMIKSKNGLF